jgi:Uma2 family endonuclease
MTQCHHLGTKQDMSTTAAQKTRFTTVADVQERLGNIPETRILLNPTPGTATVQDWLEASNSTSTPLCELVDGILVEKAKSFYSAHISMWIGSMLFSFIADKNLGAVAGSKGPIRFKPDLVRMPSISFIRWDSVDDPDEIEEPESAFLEVAPDLVVEVLSPGNTRREMEIKLSEYAQAGVKLVWYVDPERKEVDVYPKGNAKRKKTMGINDTLDGGNVLPGFTLPVAKIFAKRAPARKPGKKGRK